MSLDGINNYSSFKQFIEQLKFHQKESNQEVRVLAYITDLGKQELYDAMKRFGFSVNPLGEIEQVIINHPYVALVGTSEEKSNLEFQSSAASVYYCFYDTEKQLLLCFTYETLEEAGKRLDPFVNQKSGIIPLWIHPVVFDKIKRNIIESNENVIINEFHAKRLGRDSINVIRENYDRYFKYIADDGLFTLEEISRSYGVLPTSIVFTIPNVAKFRITNRGRFTFIHGNIDYVFEIINETLGEVLKRKSIVDKAKMEFIPVNLGRKELKLPNVIPIDIVFSREVDYVEIEKLIDNMYGEDFNFEIFDTLLIQGSVHLSGTIFDKNKNVEFNITCNSDKMTLSPRKDTNFDSLMQFYKMITEKLDLNAHIAVPEIIR